MVITDQMVEEAREMYRKGQVDYMTVVREVVKHHGVRGQELGPAISDLSRMWAAKRKAEQAERAAQSSQRLI